jgi:hypothetical protein
MNQCSLGADLPALTVALMPGRSMALAQLGERCIRNAEVGSSFAPPAAVRLGERLDGIVEVTAAAGLPVGPMPATGIQRHGMLKVGRRGPQPRSCKRLGHFCANCRSASALLMPRTATRAASWALRGRACAASQWRMVSGDTPTRRP